MKLYKNIMGVTSLTLLSLLTACSSNFEDLQVNDRNVMTFEVVHPNMTVQSRVTETNFEVNDQIGLYVTNKDMPLEVSGNYVNNSSLTYTTNGWTSAKPIYWNDGIYNVYAYFPYSTPLASVDDMNISVSLDQSVPENYVASDFLWANEKNVTASNGNVALLFSHRMSRLVIKLVKGTDYEGDLPEDAEVYIHNTVPEATVDLSVGVVTRNPYATTRTIRAKNMGNHKYAAILVPQRLDNRQPLVEVVMKGVSYLYESKFLFKQGVQHNVQLAVSKNPEQIKIEIGGEVESWE